MFFVLNAQLSLVYQILFQDQNLVNYCHYDSKSYAFYEKYDFMTQ